MGEEIKTEKIEKEGVATCYDELLK